MSAPLKYRFVFIFLMLIQLSVYVSLQASASVESILNEYNNIEEKLLDFNGEIAEIQNFIYKKDAATFTFTDGKILLLRKINDRPTVAIFVGEGNVTIDIPYLVEHERLMTITESPDVNQDIEVCYIRFADSLDILLKSMFDFKEGRLNAKERKKVKTAQGEYFFKPTVWDFSDNYFRLLRSAYTRDTDSFFWAHFNRYAYSYDPLNSEASHIYYEREIASQKMFLAASFPDLEKQKNCTMGHIPDEYPSRCIGQKSKMHIGGSDGYEIFDASSTMKIIKEKISSRFISVYLNEDLNLDSLFCNGKPVDFIRRKDFNHIGIILPEVCNIGDTLEISLYYHAYEYRYPYAYITNDEKYEHQIEFITPKEYNYYFTGKIDSTKTDEKNTSYYVSQGRFNNEIIYSSLVTGYDTLYAETDFGLKISFALNSQENSARLSKSNTFLHEKTRQEFVSTLEYFNEFLGKPIIENDLFVRLGYFWRSSASGLINIPLTTRTQEEFGGHIKEYSLLTSHQWFGYPWQYDSHREQWFAQSFPQYLSMMCVEDLAGKIYYINNLEYFRGVILEAHKDNEDLPLGSGVSGWSSKGVWTIHMLRELMNSVDSVKDESFKGWLRDVMQVSYKKPLTNRDIQVLAENHFGYELQWFFDKWVYGRGLVDFDVAYTIVKNDDGYYVNMDIETTEVPENYLAPLVISVETKDKPMFINAMISPKYKKYKYGPFEDEPKEIQFNKYLRILCESDVRYFENEDQIAKFRASKN